MELRKEYEAIRSRAIQGLCVPANQVTVGTVIDAVREAVTACQELADRPPKELTDAEIDAIFRDHIGHEAGHYNPFERQAGRDIIAAFLAKQREPQVVKFRALRSRDDGSIVMARADAAINLAGWEWLEPAQEFEVRI